MKLPFYACPECHKDFRADVQNPDQSVRCPHCKKTVHLPKKPAAKWFVARGKDKIGPLTLNQLQELADKSELQRDTMLLKDGDGLWVRAGDFPLLFPEPSTIHTAPRYSKRFMIAVSSIVAVLLLGGGWIVFSKPNATENGPSANKEKDANNDKPPPAKDGQIPTPKIIDPPTTIPDIAKKAFHKIKRYREDAGAPPLGFSMEFSDACEAHAKYLAQNPNLPKKQWNDEYSKRPGFSENGKTAARWSFVFAEDPLSKIDESMARARIRTAFINPRLEKIGIGYAKSKKHGDILVIDARRGEGDAIVVFPGPNQTEVPVMGFYTPPDGFKKNRRTISFPITVQFPTYYSVSDIRVSLTPSKRHQTIVEPHGKSILVFREKPFAPKTRYAVRIQANVNGKRWSKNWQFTTASGPDKKAGNFFEGVSAKINQYRLQSGLKPVSVNPRHSMACSDHAAYLIHNLDNPKTRGKHIYSEYPDLRRYTPEGHHAAQHSNILVGNFKPTEAVDAWMSSFYHRLSLLDPRLKSIGIGIAHNSDNVWATVVDVLSNIDKKLTVPPVIYPVANQTAVPRAFQKAGDIFDPIPNDPNKSAGFPITIHFPGNIRPSNVDAKLFAGKQRIPCWVSHPGSPANREYKDFQFNTIGVIAHEPLRSNTQYRVEVKAQWNGRPFRKVWQFSTKVEAAANDAGGEESVIAQINRYRKWAGVPPVAFEPRFSKGCRLHAEYLRLNLARNDPGTQDLSQEYQSKPGFSREGQIAAGRAFIRAKLRTLSMAVDDFMRRPETRPFLLDPQWRFGGVGCAYDAARGWITVLDVLGDRKFFVRYPSKNAEDVPRFGPNAKAGAINFPIPIVVETGPTGYPITVSFLHHAANPIPRLFRKSVLGWTQIPLYDAGQPIANTVQMIPAYPLERRTRYRVSLIVHFGDWEWTINGWEFTTKD